MTILLTGRTGQVGAELMAALTPLGTVVACSREELDLANPESIVTTVRRLRPSLIVNAAAYTAVDRAEKESDLAMAVNATGPQILAAEAARLNATLVHYSTDYVFDGTQTAPYDETAVPNPLNAYGRSKLAGERAIQQSGARHLIFRTSWVYNATGRNFVTTMLRLAAEREEIKVVNDQFGAPTWSRDIALATAAVLTGIKDIGTNVNPAVSRPAANISDAQGIYHLSAHGVTSWHEFATAILANTPAMAIKTKLRLIPIPATEYPTPTIRPRNSVLNNDKLRRTFCVTLPDWLASLRECLAAVNIH